jgi:uncharacterized protein (TIGR03790 family)
LALSTGLLGCDDSGSSASGGGGAGGVTPVGGGGAGGGASSAGGAVGAGGASTEALGFIGLRTGLEPADVGVVVNTDDPLSAPIAALYVAARGIPPENVVELQLGAGSNLDAASFQAQHASLEAALPARVQALALTSMRPSTVDCMGASAAFALGFDPKYCQPGPPCLPTSPVAYHASRSTRPFDDHGLRPAMMLAATSAEDAQALIARGVAADATYPTGRGFFVRTTDAARSVRFNQFSAVVSEWNGALDMTYVDNAAGMGSDLVEGETGLLFYLTGLASVGGIDSNTYLPGALADHLTSYGGQVPTSGQMSVLAWLQSGATASYGTAIEPCNYPQKFPDARVLVEHYYHGATALEAYWKSVQWPGEGNFVGEPLARPFGGDIVTIVGGNVSLKTTSLWPGQSYALELGPTPEGPWTAAQTGIAVDAHQVSELSIDGAEGAWVRLVEE